MKLYIPTCTLNFNNIMSSESISPLGFYARRGFGNKRFYPVCANDNEEAILSFTKYPRFEVVDDGLENYPMVIEVETEDYKEGCFENVYECNGVGVYACYHTVNLNPFHSRIFFNSEAAWHSVRVKAEQSLENKFFKLYTANVRVMGAGATSRLSASSKPEDFIWSPSFLNYNLRKTQPSVERDVTLDRVRGFIYCYLIGANLSVSNEVGKLKAISKKLRNTLSAAWMSPDKKPTQIQDDEILSGIKEFNAIYSSVDEAAIANKKILNEALSGIYGAKPVDVVNFLKKYNVYEPFCRNLKLQSTYDANGLWRCFEMSSIESFNKVVERMDSAIRGLEEKAIAQNGKNDLQSLMSVNDDFSVHIKDNSYKREFYQELINSQINGEYKVLMDDKEGVSESAALSCNGGQLLKGIMGDKWAGSDVSVYMRSLLSHFQEDTLFDLFSINNIILNSFAAFCQKGDDIDRLTDYLAQTGFSNYKLAYGIYGATRGFASLPKTFTSVLIDGDRDYYSAVERYVWLCLNGVDLQRDALPQKDANPLRAVGSVCSAVPDNVSALSQGEPTNCPRVFMAILGCILSKNTKAYKCLKKAGFETDNTCCSSKGFLQKIRGFLDVKSFKKYETNIQKALELDGCRQDRKAFEALCASLSVPKDVYEKIKSAVSQVENECTLPFSPEGQQDVDGRRPETQTESPKCDKFVYDDNAPDFILSCEGLENSFKKKVSNAVASFQKSYKEGGRNSSKPSDNESTLSHFRNWCFYNSGKRPPVLEKTKENESFFDMLLDLLRSRYL